jgi:CBS domain-containing protein
VPTVADAALATPKLHPPGLSVAAARAAFDDGHVHAVLLVGGGVLVAVVERDDLVGAWDGEAAGPLGRLTGRTIGHHADLEATRRTMAARGRRRLAVVDSRGRLRGLLCLKRHGGGFCSTVDVSARR